MSDQAACAAAVASLPGMTPQRLRKLAASFASCGGEGVPDTDWEHLWRQLRAGGLRMRSLAPGRLARLWASAAAAVDVNELLTGYERAGVMVVPIGDRRYPSRLAADPEAPSVLFARGRFTWHQHPAVAVIGTRSATHYGTDVAAELGGGLAAAGVVVVSGLATGIDAAAHEGALSGVTRGRGSVRGAFGDDGPSGPAPPVAVAGAGLDVDYPHATRALRRRIEETGAVISEAALGAPAEPWRFPLRNRIIAALVSVVVVVESHRAGGSLHTVEAALARGVEVLAVPGSIRSSASAGTNALLSAGAQVATCVDDVLAAVSLKSPRMVTLRASPRHVPPREEPTVPVGTGATGATVRTGATGATGAPGVTGAGVPYSTLGDLQRRVLAAVDSTPTPTQLILGRVGEGLGPVALALDHLLDLGLVRDCGGAWERSAATRGARAGPTLERQLGNASSGSTEAASSAAATSGLV